jgi:hypothetical protein
MSKEKTGKNDPKKKEISEKDLIDPELESAKYVKRLLVKYGFYDAYKKAKKGTLRDDIHDSEEETDLEEKSDDK